MRSLYFGDVSAVARVLLGVPVDARLSACRAMIQEANAADRFLRRMGKLHPTWGNGTLRCVALGRGPEPEPSFDDPDYCACFRLVLKQVHSG